MLVRRSGLRASDADREAVAEHLRNAAADGRIEAIELEHRLEAALCARTYGELGAVVADLPREPVDRKKARWVTPRLRPVTVIALVVAFPIALAVAAAAIIALAALLVAWATAVSLLALFLGSRARAFGSPWAVGYRAWRRRQRYY